MVGIQICFTTIWNPVLSRRKTFHHVLRNKILHDSWSILAALARRSLPDRHFESGGGPGDEFTLDCYYSCCV